MSAALLGGADVIAHTTPRSGAWDETVIAAMYGRRCALVPTLKLWHDFLRHDRASVQDRFVNTAVQQLRAWYMAGAAVLFGTDLGAVDCDPRREYVFMAQAGMNFDEILASLTTAPAAQFGCADLLGRIAAGFEADLVVLNADPSENITNLVAVHATMRAGEVVYGAELVSTFE